MFELLFACKKCAQVLKTDAGTYLGISQNLLVLDSSQIDLGTPSRTTVARSDDQFSKHVNGCILGVKLFYKHSFGKKLFFF